MLKKNCKILCWGDLDFKTLRGIIETLMKDNNTKIFTGRFIIAYVSFFLISTGNALFVLYPIHLKSFGKNDASVGFLIGLTTFAALIGRPYIGSALDRLGRRKFILWGSLLNSLIIPVYAIPYYDTVFLACVRILHGFVFAAYFSAIWTWVADQAPPGRLAESLGIFGTAGLSSSAAGSFLGETALNLLSGSLPAFFSVSSALVLNGFLLSLFLPEYKDKVMKPQYGFLGLVRRFEVFTVAMACTVFGIAMGAIHTFAAPYINEQHQISVSSFFIAYSIAAVMVRSIAGRAADKLGNVTLIVPGLIVLTCGQTLLGLCPNKCCTLLMGIMLGGGHGLIYPALYALILERAGPMDRGAAGALLNASVDTGTFAGAGFFGIVASKWGYMTMYTTAGISTVGGLLLFLLLERVLCKSCRE